MITQRLVKSVAALRAAQAEFDAALFECLGAKNVPAPSARPTETRTPTQKPEPDPARKPLPPNVLPGKDPGLSDETRAANLPDAVAIAKRVIQAVGANGQMLVEGVRGQLILERVPFDDKLVAMAIEQAKRGA